MTNKLESTLKNMVIVLTGTAVLTGALLAIVNGITEKKIADQMQKDELASVYSALELNPDSCKIASVDTVTKNFEGKGLQFLIYNAKDANNNEVGAAVKSVSAGFGGNLGVMVGFNKEGVVKGYKILESSETPGLGAKADIWFQKGQKGNIVGKKAGSLVTNKDDAEADSLKVDAITASTITSRAFLKAVNQAYHAYMDTEHPDAVTSASKQEKKDGKKQKK